MPLLALFGATFAVDLFRPWRNRPWVNFEQLKESPAWRQLTTEERRFLKAHLNDPKKATKVRIVLERAEAKASAQSRIKLPPPQLEITLPSGKWRAIFLSANEVELKGEMEIAEKATPVSVVLRQQPNQGWLTRADFPQGPVQHQLEVEFAGWVETHPNFMQFASRVSA